MATTLSDKIIEKAQTEERFRARLRKNPRATVDEYLERYGPQDFKLPAWVEVYVVDAADDAYYLVLPPSGGQPPYDVTWREVLPSSSPSGERVRALVRRARTEDGFRSRLFKEPTKAVEEHFRDQGLTRKGTNEPLRFEPGAELKIVQTTWDDLYLLLPVPPPSVSLTAQEGIQPTLEVGQTCPNSTNAGGCCSTPP